MERMNTLMVRLVTFVGIVTCVSSALSYPLHAEAKATISQANISVVSGTNPATYGESIVFSTHITVTGSTTPSGGTVKFMEVFPGQGFQTPLGYSTLDSSSNASFTLLPSNPAYLSASTTAHQIKVAYLGDANFNAATSSAALAQIVSADVTPPTITLVGSSTVTLAAGSTYTELGATATDAIDGTLTSSIVVGGSSVNTQVAGVYVVTYSVSDSSSNSAQATRTVTVTDTTAPVITLNGNTPMQVLRGAVFTDPGAVVTDNADLSTSAATATGSVDTATIGTYTITYTATDVAGNAADQVTRTVNVVDTTSPIITLTGSNPQRISVHGTYTELGATISDDTDTGLSATINASAVNTAAAGTYQVTYDATDLSGNVATQVVRTVIVADTTAPVITLSGSASVSLTTGDGYTDAGASATDDVDSAVTVAATGTVDTATAGTYTITYSATDMAGNAATPVTRTITVSNPAPAPVRRSSGGGGSSRSPGTVTTTGSVTPTAGRVLGASTFVLSSRLSSGMQGQEVTELQNKLIASGFLTGTSASGYFGPMTRAALMAYQAAHGLEQTGAVGPRTLGLLNAEVAAPAASANAQTLASLLSQLAVLRAKLAAL